MDDRQSSLTLRDRVLPGAGPGDDPKRAGDMALIPVVRYHLGRQGFHRKEFDLHGLSRGFLSAYGRQRPMSIANYPARKVTHCHADASVRFWPLAARANSIS